MTASSDTDTGSDGVGSFGLAVSPAALTALAPHGPAAPWGSLAAATLVSASAVATEKDGSARRTSPHVGDLV